VLNAGVLSYDAQGRVLTTLTQMGRFNGGTPVVDGKLCITLSEPEVYLGGLSYLNDGSVCYEQDLNTDGGIANGRGQLRSSTEPPAFWYCGLPVTADGRLSIAPPILPTTHEFDPAAYSDAFA